ncbi:MAG TPA: PilC/PilY family type IV pilus protein [Rhodanobacteraceae bacterium]|nr:PilC/PilY family type IV pilus protein [Rhodanobacteraceae bacterium]
MILSRSSLCVATAALAFFAGIDPADAMDIAQQPLFTTSTQPPLNMLVVGKDHKLFYEAYNDASDLNGDGQLDVGYKASVEYYGYFDSHKCYSYASGLFTPTAVTDDKKCPGSWSGDFLNYVTTSRIDALRKVLYGGTRSTDTATSTVIERAYIPQDAHSWGKEYQSVARDGYDIHDYTPYNAPAVGRYLLFANTTLLSSVTNLRNPDGPPLLRVMQNSPFRIWNWVSIERPVAGDDCFTAANARVNCLTGGGGSGWEIVPSSAFSALQITQWDLNHSSPAGTAAMTSLFVASGRRLCGTSAISNIDGSGNRFAGQNGCATNNDNYITKFAGTLNAPAGGAYQFAVDGDDAVDVLIDGTLVASWYGGHADCGGCTTHAGSVNLTAGAHSIVFRHEEVSGGDNYHLHWLTPGGSASASRTDYTVRVEVCKDDLLEDNCKKYTQTDADGDVTEDYKPTGLLHDYGENGSMMFGLLTGSFMHNRQGGVLRKQIGMFTDEVDPDTGQFTWHTGSFKGIISTLDGLKINDFERNYSHDYACNNSGWYGPVADGVCRIWGNPIGEMMFETLRYFGGADAPEPEYVYTDAGSDDATLNMPEVATWKDPYTATDDGGLGFLACAKPFETVISDINPSYDSNLPGGAFGGAPSGTLPTRLQSLDVGALGQNIWDHEIGAERNVYIGQVGTLSDGAPTAKAASSFGNIRGLSPEEPTKQGSYYSASVAYFGNTRDLSAAEGDQKMQTFAVAVASPLPRIAFPVGDQTVTLVPFAKSVAGNSIDPNGAFQSTDQIVDFYVEKIVNVPGQVEDATVNEGRPYAKFRINYEDIEQGNDHDMDAIVSYTISANADNTVTVALNSEYAAGSVDQHMGYVISGTNKDGIYLEVRDIGSSNAAYRLDTPEGFDANGCLQTGSFIVNPACSGLPLNHTRTFTPGTDTAAQVLKDPLWYAAKYGGFNDTNLNGVPDDGEWDDNVTGTPDNYFLVTNALGLKDQLKKAFDAIILAAAPTASVATSTPRFVPGATLVYEASFDASDWSGNLRAFRIRSDGVYTGAPPVWSASDEMPAAASRNIVTSKPQTDSFTGLGVDFTAAELTPAMQAKLMAGLDTTVYDFDDVLAYLRGDHGNEQDETPPGPYRTRGQNLGDILNSTPAVGAVTSFGYGQLLKDIAPTAAAAYAAFVQSKKSIFGDNSENPVVFVGSNDGMMHAVDGSEGTDGGKELFAYVPNAVLDTMNELLKPTYTHRYYVDGSPTLSDAYLGAWKTVLLGSTGAGSRSVFALDVTNPRSFTKDNVMWEFNSNGADPDSQLMGQFVGRPWLGITEDGTWVATFGNGYNSANNEAVLFIRKLADGSKVATLSTGAGCAEGDAGCGTEEGPNGLTTAVLVDNDGNGAGDTIYAGDYLGNLWRFEYVSGAWAVGNSGSPIFVARDSDGKRQSITGGVYTVANPLGGTMVIFGTGRYLNTDDADINQIGQGTRAAEDTIYGIWDSRGCSDFDEDSHRCTTWSTGMAISASDPRSDLQQQKITGYTPMDTNGNGGYRTATRNPVDFRLTDGGTGKLGWFLDLSFNTGTSPNFTDLMAGERVIVKPDGILSDVVVNTIRPDRDTCDPGLQNATMVLDALTGAADYVPIVPPGGWPGGVSPPPGLVGTDTYKGPPQGEPPILIIRPPIPGVPCLPGSTGCVTPPPLPPDTPTSCTWRSPNSTNHPPGKPMPCGRISWKQLR